MTYIYVEIKKQNDSRYVFIEQTNNNVLLLKLLELNSPYSILFGEIQFSLHVIACNISEEIMNNMRTIIILKEIMKTYLRKN
jgi:hypothetical protein